MTHKKDYDNPVEYQPSTLLVCEELIKFRQDNNFKPTKLRVCQHIDDFGWDYTSKVLFGRSKNGHANLGQLSKRIS